MLSWNLKIIGLWNPWSDTSGEIMSYHFAQYRNSASRLRECIYCLLALRLCVGNELKFHGIGFYSSILEYFPLKLCNNVIN